HGRSPLRRRRLPVRPAQSPGGTGEARGNDDENRPYDRQPRAPRGGRCQSRASQPHGGYPDERSRVRIDPICSASCISERRPQGGRQGVFCQATARLPGQVIAIACASEGTMTSHGRFPVRSAEEAAGLISTTTSITLARGSCCALKKSPITRRSSASSE